MNIGAGGDNDYRERVRAAALLRGRKMIQVRCPVGGCQSASGAVYDSRFGPLYEATVPFPEVVRELEARGDLHDKQARGTHVPYPDRRVLELVEEGGFSDLDAACKSGHVGVVTTVQLRAAAERYRSAPRRPAQIMHT